MAGFYAFAVNLTSYFCRGEKRERATERVAESSGACYYGSVDWKDNLLREAARIRELISQTQRVAVLGIKTEKQAAQPAFYVPEYLDAAGFEVIPVPVYYPDVTAILGKKVFRRLVDIPGEIDLVDVFRRPRIISRLKSFAV